MRSILFFVTDYINSYFITILQILKTTRTNSWYNNAYYQYYYHQKLLSSGTHKLHGTGYYTFPSKVTEIAFVASAIEYEVPKETHHTKGIILIMQDRIESCRSENCSRSNVHPQWKK